MWHFKTLNSEKDLGEKNYRNNVSHLYGLYNVTLKADQDKCNGWERKVSKCSRLMAYLTL